MDLIIENVRCFAGRHVAPLAPLTILVGENSSGKSTLVALTRVAWDAMSSWDTVDFNEEPFRLGAFEDIVNTTSAARCASFAVGFRFPPRTADSRRVAASLVEDVEVRAEFTGKDAQPSLAEWFLRSGGYSIRHVAPKSEDENAPILYIDAPSGRLSFTARDLPMPPSILAISRNWHFFRMRLTSDSPLLGKLQGRLPSEADFGVLDFLVSSLDVGFRQKRPYASAPIRTQPKRTYDPLTDKATPEGDHVPMMLAKRQATRPHDPGWKALLDSLHRFGSEAGLFASLDVKRMGGNEANLPFQLRVGFGEGPAFNLIDVGYGVSQVLPVLVDAITNRGRIMLLQQPEVHLHPKAQAELGSFLGRLANEPRAAPILVETHSDYLLDRIRMDIRDKKGLSSKDVVILYLSRTNQGTLISPIRIDEHGNLVNPPNDYRAFFLAEERRFLQG